VFLLYELPARAEFPFRLLDQSLELLVLPAHAAVVLLLAQHTHGPLAERTPGIVVPNEPTWNVGKTILPGAIGRVWRIMLLQPQAEGFHKFILETTMLLDHLDRDTLAAAGQLAPGFEAADNTLCVVSVLAKERPLDE
jgi:hypothetical protein